MRRGGAPQAAFSKFKAVPEPSLAAVRIPMKGKTFPVDFSIPRSALFPDAPALPDEIKDVALTVSARLDQDGVAATRGPDDLVGAMPTHDAVVGARGDRLEPRASSSLSSPCEHPSRGLAGWSVRWRRPGPTAGAASPTRAEHQLMFSRRTFERRSRAA